MGAGKTGVKLEFTLEHRQFWRIYCNWDYLVRYRRLNRAKFRQNSLSEMAGMYLASFQAGCRAASSPCMARRSMSWTQAMADASRGDEFWRGAVGVAKFLHSIRQCNSNFAQSCHPPYLKIAVF